jgi:hypothetical protein
MLHSVFEERDAMAGAKFQSVFDTPPDDDAEVLADAGADAEIEDGRGVPHERVREWLAKLAKGEIAEIPEA